MGFMDRSNYGILIEAKPFMILWLLMLSYLVLQVHGGSLSQKTESTPTRTNCDDDQNWTELYPGAGFPTCVNRTWVCPYEGQCQSFTYTTHRYNPVHYFCGPCGGIGSRCNLPQGLTCIANTPTRCIDNWCRCKDRKDYEQGAICQKQDTHSLFSPDIFILSILLILIILINKLIKSGKSFRDLWARRRSCCCCLHSGDSDSDDETSIVGVNERAGEKSASYTMSNNDFMATSDDPDLEWALELSRTMREANGEWIEGTASVRPRPSTSNTSQPSRRRSARSILSVDGSLGGPSQSDCTSVMSTGVEDSIVPPQLETNSLSESMPDDSELIRCGHLFSFMSDDFRSIVGVNERAGERSARSINSVDGSLGGPSQADCTSVKSTGVEYSIVPPQLETNSLSESMPDDIELIRCRHQEHESTPSTSTSNNLDNMPSRESSTSSRSCSDGSVRSRL